MAAPADRSPVRASAIAMPSRSNALLTGTGLTWDRNRVLLPVVMGILPPPRLHGVTSGKAVHQGVHPTRGVERYGICTTDVEPHELSMAGLPRRMRKPCTPTVLHMTEFRGPLRLFERLRADPAPAVATAHSDRACEGFHRDISPST